MRHIVSLFRPSALAPVALLALFLLFSFPASAQDDTLNTGDTAWMLTSTVLVLFMTIPGLALFYGGLVRSKNVLSVLMQCLGLTALISVLWAIIAYSLAFDTGGMAEGALNLHSLVGGFGKAFLAGVRPESLSGTIPETVFICFQMTFAIITPALICGRLRRAHEILRGPPLQRPLARLRIRPHLPHGLGRVRGPFRQLGRARLRRRNRRPRQCRDGRACGLPHPWENAPGIPSPRCRPTTSL